MKSIADQLDTMISLWKTTNLFLFILLFTTCSSVASADITNLPQAHPLLQALFGAVCAETPCEVITVHRGKQAQDQAYRRGFSRVKYPNSKHNRIPSLAVDIGPAPLDWGKPERWYLFAGKVQGMAKRLGIRVRWGGDWDGDGDLYDNKLVDLAHWELIVPKVPKKKKAQD